MLSRRCQNSQKSENTQTSEVNSKFFQKSVRNMIHHCNRQAFIILVLFTVPFYHFLFSRYLDLTKRHFSSDILVPFPDSSNLYSRAYVVLDYNFEEVILSILNFHVFVQSLHLSSTEETNWLISKGMCVLLCDAFNGFSLSNEINRLISKGMSNICH